MGRAKELLNELRRGNSLEMLTQVMEFLLEREFMREVNEKQGSRWREAIAKDAAESSELAARYKELVSSLELMLEKVKY